MLKMRVRHKIVEATIGFLLLLLVFGPDAVFSQTTTQNLRGREMALPWRGKQIPVYIPTNYDAQKPTSVFLLYPGTHGVASTALIKQASEGKGFIVVGMFYLQDGTFTGSQGSVPIYRRPEGWNVQWFCVCVPHSADAEPLPSPQKKAVSGLRVFFRDVRRLVRRANARGESP